MKLKKFLNEEKLEAPRAGAIVYYLSTNKIEICLVISSNPVYGGPDPQLPKGKIENESSKDTAIREAIEETGISQQNIVKVFYLTKGIIREDFYPPFSLELYGIEVNTKSLNKPDSEIKSAMWYPLEISQNIITKYQKDLFLKGLKKIKR
jgi:8-oxo-dGTP pyrophosphatase MutT (NUDIX family)